MAILAAALGAGCGGEDAGGGRDPSRSTLALDFYVNPDHAGIYTALERGDFAEAGLEVEPQVPSDPSAPIRQVAAGRVDLAISYEPEVVLARDQGLPVVAVAALVPEPLTSLISLPEAGIDDPADLEGKTIATAGIPYQAAFLESILEDAGLAGGDVDQVEVGPQPAARGALGPRRRDARRLPQRRGGRPGRARRGSSGRAGRRARDPHLRRARPGREHRAGRVRPRANPQVHRRAGAAEREPRPTIPRRPPRRSSRRATGSSPSSPRAEIEATLPLLAGGGEKPFGYMDAGEWDEFAAFLADRGLVDPAPPADELLTNELLPD